MHDLVIRGGMVVDGTGAAPRVADVAVDGDRIVAVEIDAARGRREIDADGLVVTPGFVDVHTHFDAQATWDPHLTPSGWHGVTTAIMGNCGVGFAPADPTRREWLIELMEGVEDIPGSALADGIQWDWESFPEYLDALDRFPRAIDVGTHVPHAAMRAYVMQERAALTRPNVRLVTEPIVEITDAGVRTADGEEHRVDTIIYGTGFKANEYLSAVDIRGRAGRRLRDDWQDGAEAYLGLTVPGYPNLFMLYGPNTNGVNSIIFMHEAQARYIVSALRSMTRHRYGAVEVRAGVNERYNRRIQAAMAGTVWTAGCDNYFRLPNGNVVTQLPYSGGRYWLRTRIFDRWRYRATRSNPRKQADLR